MFRSMKKHRISYLISLLVVVSVLTCTFLGLRVNAATTKPSVATLESLLNNRAWVLDTIVDGDYTTHPMNDVNPLGVESFDSYATYSYTKIAEHPAMQAFISAVYFLYNGGDLMTDWLIKQPWSSIREMATSLNIEAPEEQPEEINGIIQAISDACVSITKTTKEKYYDAILKGIFNTEYDSEYYSLDDEEIYLSEIRNLFGVADKISSMKSTLSSWIGTGSDALSEYQNWYIHRFLPDYEGSITDYLNAYSKEIERAACLSGEYTVEEMNELKSWTDATQLVSIYQAYEADEDNLIDWTKSVQAATVLDKASDVLSAIGKTTDFVNGIYENYILLEALQYQKESSINVLDRLFNQTNSAKLRLSLRSIYNLMHSEYNNLTALYCATRDFIEDQDIIHDLASDTVKKAANNNIIKRNSMKTAKFCSSAVSALAILDIGLTIADRCTGIEETANKYFQIKLALDLIEDMQAVYYSDLAAYQADKTEENAQTVLDDLLFLKKTRLYVTKMVYDSGAAQVGSWIFQIFADDATEAQWKKDYQDQIHILLSATISPIASAPLSITADQLWIDTSTDCAKVYQDGETYYILEASKRFLNGLIFHGNTLRFYGGGAFYTSLLQTNVTDSVTISAGTSVVIGSDCSVSSLKFNSGTVTINGNASIGKA